MVFFGLSTISYLFGGQVTHRDSLGVEQVIRLHLLPRSLFHSFLYGFAMVAKLQFYQHLFQPFSCNQTHYFEPSCYFLIMTLPVIRSCMARLSLLV
jgi:hypothetical protein